MSSNGWYPTTIYVQRGVVCVSGPSEIPPGIPLSPAVREDPHLPSAGKEHTVATPPNGFQKDSDIQRPYFDGCQWQGLHLPVPSGLSVM